MHRAIHGIAAWAASALLLTACSVERNDEAPADTAASAAAPQSGATTVAVPIGDTGAAAGTAATAADPGIRVEVDVAARKLYLVEGSQRTATYDVAVGSEKWPTQTGEWRITQVVFNPDWVPPDESWAEEREPRESGDPKNPLGRVQLVYDPPRSIHGTNQPSSIGKAVSHGSIRMRNAELEKVAVLLMEKAGAPKDEAWLREARENRTRKQIVDLPNPVPIRVY